MQQVYVTILGKTYRLRVPMKSTTRDILEYLRKEKKVPIESDTRFFVRAELSLDVPLGSSLSNSIKLHISRVIDEIEDCGTAESGEAVTTTAEQEKF